MIAIDWGTTRLRAYRVAGDGAVRERRVADAGILAVPDGDFAGALLALVHDWIAAGEARILMSGMIGSRQGWREAPYVSTPAGPDRIGEGLVPVEVRPGLQAWIVPGVVTLGAGGVHDVMRGEETQVLGVARSLGSGRHLLCLPGTHSKWVDLEDGRITALRTHMTGEVFAVLAGHSILGRTMPATDDFHEDAFLEGVARSGHGGGLLHHLFGVRAQCLTGALAEEATRDYLSGLLLGHELRQAPEASVTHLLGDPGLAERYRLACTHLGRKTYLLDPDAAAAGLYGIASALGWLDHGSGA